LPSRPERHLVAALGFAVPAVWAGLGAATAVACVFASAAAYTAAGFVWRPALVSLRTRARGLTAPRPPRRAPARPRAQRYDEPSESGMSGYGW
jgi:hypothetical protein